MQYVSLPEKRPTVTMLPNTHTRARAHVQVYIAVKDHPKKSLSLISTENLNHL